MNRRTLLIAVAAALAVLVLWYVLFWSPRGAAIDKAKKRQRTADAALQELRIQRDRLVDLRRNEAAFRAQIEQLRQAIPDEPNLAQFILDANDAANQSGIDFLSISPTPPAPAPEASAPAGGGPAPAPIALGITVDGGYFQVLDFVNRLNRLSRIVVIDGLSIGAGTGTGLSVTLTGRMFVTSAPAGSAAPSNGTSTPGASTTTIAGATTTTAPGGASTTVAP